MIINREYNKLTPNDKEKLLYAFEHCITTVIKLDNNKFIGVNVPQSQTYEIECEEGLWSYGNIR